MPAITTRGAASAKAFGWSSGGGPGPYIEELFSTYLYTGNGSTQTITNGIDLSTKGGLVWCKSRSAVGNNGLTDTVRGTGNSSSTSGELYTNSTVAPGTTPGIRYSDVTSFNSTGFNLSYVTSTENSSGVTYGSWTFRKQPKFFDVVTWTGTGSNTTIAHALGSVPGCIIVKRTDTAADWAVYNRSLANTQYLVLSTTAAAATGATWWNSTTPTSSVFSVGTDASVNASGGTYVAYIYAHNAGGFGLTGADNVISCGSYTGNGSTTGPVVTLGYEPQWLMVKRTDAAESWNIVDNMRGLSVGDTSTTAHSPRLRAELSNAEQGSGWVIPTSTGFQIYGSNAASGSYNASGGTYIYIAIRRGPMKVPTVGTTVYNAIARTGTGAVATVTGVGFASDLVFSHARGTTSSWGWFDRLRGATNILLSNSTNAESVDVNSLTDFGVMDGYTLGDDSLGFTTINLSAITYSNQAFKRAPSFFDAVCYTGNGTTTTISHNLTVAPELFIIKCRDGVTNWSVPQTMISGGTSFLALNGTGAITAVASGTVLGDNVSYVAPTSSVFTLGSQVQSNNSGFLYIAYLFATCAGVSKVGSYTGNGSNQTIACGFTAGSRFVMIKRTDSTGDWYVWDSVRGIVAANDPHLSLNTTAAEVTTDDSIDTDNSGFIVNQLAATNINVTSATYIFLAIA